MNHRTLNIHQLTRLINLMRTEIEEESRS